MDSRFPPLVDDTNLEASPWSSGKITPSTTQGDAREKVDVVVAYKERAGWATQSFLSWAVLAFLLVESMGGSSRVFGVYQLWRKP